MNIIVLALTLGVSYAHESSRSMASNRLHVTPVEDSPQGRYAAERKIKAALHARAVTLKSRKYLHFMMVLPLKRNSDAFADYAFEKYFAMADDLANTVAFDLAAFEVELAERLGVPPEDVARVVDVGHDFARLNLAGGSTDEFDRVITERRPALGGGILYIYLTELAKRTLPSIDVPPLMLSNTFYNNLNSHLNAALDEVRRQSKPASDARAWLNADAPTGLPKDQVDVIAVTKPAGDAGSDTMNVDPNTLREFVEAKGCANFLEHAEDPPDEIAPTTSIPFGPNTIGR